MNFNEQFPQLIEAAANLHGVLAGLAIPLLVLSFALFFWRLNVEPVEVVRHLVLVFIVILLITRAQSWINAGQQMVQSLVEQNIPARPENVAARYRELLERVENNEGDGGRSFTGMLLGGDIFEAVLYAILLLVSWLAIALQFFIFIVQKTSLLLCWSISPLVFPCFLLRPLAGLAWGHLLRILGIILWPIGIALAATVTDGLIGLAVKKEMFDMSGLGGVVGTGVVHLFAVAAIGLWVWVSTVAAPLYVQRFVAGGGFAAGLVQGTADRTVDSVSQFFMQRIRPMAFGGASDRVRATDTGIPHVPSPADLARVGQNSVQEERPEPTKAAKDPNHVEPKG